MSYGGNIADHQIHCGTGKLRLVDTNCARLTGKSSGEEKGPLIRSRPVTLDTTYVTCINTYTHNGIPHEF